MASRYAVYYLPAPESELYALGAALLGRCLYSGRKLPRPALKNIEPQFLEKHTRAAAGYGFHGTIVAPFETSASEVELGQVLAAVCAESPAFKLENPALAAVGGKFAAIVPGAMPQELKNLEDRCVRRFSPFRRPLSQRDIDRRGALSPKLMNNLRNWGYHLVFDEFRFHLTAADSLPEDPAPFLAALKDYFAPALIRPWKFDRLALLYQPGRSEPFLVRQIFPLQDCENEH